MKTVRKCVSNNHCKKDNQNEAYKTLKTMLYTILTHKPTEVGKEFLNIWAATVLLHGLLRVLLEVTDGLNKPGVLVMYKVICDVNNEIYM